MSFPGTFNMSSVPENRAIMVMRKLRARPMIIFQFFPNLKKYLQFRLITIKDVLNVASNSELCSSRLELRWSEKYKYKNINFKLPPCPPSTNYAPCRSAFRVFQFGKWIILYWVTLNCVLKFPTLFPATNLIYVFLFFCRILKLSFLVWVSTKVN